MTRKHIAPRDLVGPSLPEFNPCLFGCRDMALSLSFSVAENFSMLEKDTKVRNYLRDL